MPLKFEWKENKAEANIRKHNVSFEEAKTVFGDPFARISPDTDHSEHEERWHIIGMSKQNRVLLVAYTERNDTIRMITSRKAEPWERKCYEEFRFRHR